MERKGGGNRWLDRFGIGILLWEIWLRLHPWDSQQRWDFDTFRILEDSTWAHKRSIMLTTLWLFFIANIILLHIFMVKSRSLSTHRSCIFLDQRTSFPCENWSLDALKPEELGAPHPCPPYPYTAKIVQADAPVFSSVSWDGETSTNSELTIFYIFKYSIMHPYWHLHMRSHVYVGVYAFLFETCLCFGWKCRKLPASLNSIVFGGN